MKIEIEMTIGKSQKSESLYLNINLFSHEVILHQCIEENYKNILFYNFLIAPMYPGELYKKKYLVL